MAGLFAARGRTNPNLAFEMLRHSAAQARMPHDREAWLNLAFYLDEQYVQWDDTTQGMSRIPRKKEVENTPRPVVNKIMHYIQSAHAEVLSDKPSADVLPATDDLLAIGDAAVSKAYCTYVSEPVNANWDKVLARASLWSLLAGNGYVKWTWDAQNKCPSIIPPSFFEIFPDPYAKDFGKARYVVHSQFMDVEQVYEAWGVTLKAGASAADPMRTELLRGMGSAPVLSGVTVNELWHKPSRRYPEGLYTVWSGNETITAPGALPYDHKRLPFTQVGCIERPDSMYYKSPVSYLRSAQMILNKYHAQRIMVRERFANPKWWVPAELELEVLPNDAPNQILRGISQNGMLKPEIIQAAGMPDNGDGAMIEEQMMHIVGQHEVSQAQVPGRVEAAKAIEILKESDEGRYKAMLDTIDQSMSEGWYQILMLAKQYESEKVMLQTYSREGLPEVKAFRTERIEPGMRIKVTRTNGLGRSRSARQDSLMNLWQQKIITDPELMAELLEVPIPSFTSAKALDLRLARNENIDLAKAVPITANSWDDHVIHLREHNDYRKTQEFLEKPLATKTVFEHHCEMHDQLMLADMQKQAQKSQLMAAIANPQPPGGPGGPSGPTGPSDGTATPPSGDGSVQA